MLPLPPPAHLGDIESDIWLWMRDFVAVKNAFYNAKFPPCPYALRALMDHTVDVIAWRGGDWRGFIRQHATAMREHPRLTTRVMAFAPRTQHAWGMSTFVETLNTELIPHNIFLNTGVAKTSVSRHPGAQGQPYFIVVANSLDAVLAGAQALKRTGYYDDWPSQQVEIVVQRRERLAARHRHAPGTRDQ